MARTIADVCELSLDRFERPGEGFGFSETTSCEMDDDRIPMQITSVAQSEVSAILARRGIRRSSAGGLPPLAGLFDAEPEVVEEDEDVDLDAADSVDGAAEGDAADVDPNAPAGEESDKKEDA